MTRPTATYLIAYDVARTAAEKHALATRIMSLGEAWARPLEQIWYVRAERRAAHRIGAELAAMIGEDDGIIVQETTEEAVMANTTLRWFRRRAAPVAEVSPNVVAFPIIAAPTAWTQGRAPGEAAGNEVADGDGVVRLAEAS
ncbi:MAG: hypothetical protein R3D27_07245 [Hyphomicrobiaceae bacterium]